MIDIKHLAKYHASRNIPLNYEEAYELGVYALKGCDGDQLAQIQSIALFTALHNKALYSWRWSLAEANIHPNRLPSNSAEQIAGICAAIFQNDIGKSEFGFVKPNVEYAMDNCGMGGDLILTANLSTISGFIAASAGIPMCKHGSPANADQGKYGSSDFISLICGINNYGDKKVVERAVEQIGFGYTEACDTRYKKIHLQTHRIAMMPHMNDIIGPITNPLSSSVLTRRVLGVNHLIPLTVVAEAYQIMNHKKVTNLKHGLFVRGFIDKERNSGMDEVSICIGGTQVVELVYDKVFEYELFAKDFGVETVSVDDVVPIGNKGEYSMSLLKGEISGNRLNVVLANAAPLFYLSGYSDNFIDCFQKAKSVFESGKPYQTMLAVKEALPLC